VTSAARVPLTEPQALMLRMCVAGARAGRVAAGLDPVMCALERRDLVMGEPVDRAATHRREQHRFIATPEGRMWVAAANAAEGLAPAERITPSSLWQGRAVDGSRWTAAQLAALRKEGVPDPERCPVGIISRRAAVNESDWTRPPPVIRTELPCLARSRDHRRGKLVLPAGAVQWHDITDWRAAARG